MPRQFDRMLALAAVLGTLTACRDKNQPDAYGNFEPSAWATARSVHGSLPTTRPVISWPSLNRMRT